MQSKTPKKLRAIAIAAIFSFSLSAEAHASWASALAWFATMQREVAAVAIQVKQNAVYANQISDANVNSNKQLAAAMGALMTSERVREVVQNYDPVFGQPMLLKCDAQFDRQLQIETFHQSSKNTLEFVSNFAVASAKSRVAADQGMLEQHREFFCSVSEAKQGLCDLKPNGMQSWNSSYAAPFGEQTLTPDVELAGFNYISNVVDTRATDDINCKSEACASARLKNMRDTAIGSMVAESLVGQLSMRRSTVLE